MKTRIFAYISLILIAVLMLPGSVIPAAAAPKTSEAQDARHVYLPLVLKPPITCATGQSYSQGPVHQYDRDDPVRRAWNHADKNIGMIGYTGDVVSQTKQLMPIGGDTDASAPQLSTLVSPARKLTITSTRRSYIWNWQPPNIGPGSRGNLIPDPITAAAGFQVTQYEVIRAPHSGYDLGAGARSIVLYATPYSITLHYTRDDSGYPGYTIFIDNVCVDPNLLALYNSLDNGSSGPRNTYYPDNNNPYYPYNLPTLTENQPIGKAYTTELVVIIRDSGSMMDPRVCKDWWKAWWNESTSSPVCY